MTKASVAPLMVVVVLATVACGAVNRLGGGETRCTLIGCESQISVRMAGAGLEGEAGVVEVRMCFDEACDVQRVRFKANGAVAARPGSDVAVFPMDDDLVATLRLPEGDYDDTTQHHVTAEITIDGADPILVERDITLTRSEPNGPACGPVCWQATIEA